MSRLTIEGRRKLSGTIRASGNKNATLKLLPACLLTDEPVTLHNIPDIADVNTVIEIMRYLGADVRNLGDGSWRIHAARITKTT